MSTEIQRRRGTTVEHASFTGADGEITVDTDKKVPVVHDAATAGGWPAAASSHTHTADQILGGSGFVIAVSAGGTGASTAASALTNLGGASLLHVHDSEDITGFGSNIRYVDSQAQFASAYAGTAKTIVLGANSYTTPSTFIQGINLFHLGDADDVTLTGPMTVDTAGAGVTQTTFRGITVDGNIVFRAPFDNTLRFDEVVQNTGNIELIDASGILSITGGKINSYIVQTGTLRTIGTELTGGNARQTGGSVEHRDIVAEINAAGVIIQAGADPVAEETSILFPTGSSFVTASSAATHWRINTPSTEYYVWYNSGSAIDPAASGTGIQVNASSTDPASVIASNTASALGQVGGASVVFDTSGIADFADGFVVITNVATGLVSSALDVNASVTASVRTLGADSSGILAIEGIRLNNPLGQGLRLEGDAVATINGFIVTGSILTNGLTVAGSAVLNLGTHNLTSVSAVLITGSSGTVVALDHPIGVGAIDSGSQIISGIIEGSHIAACTVTRFNVEPALKQLEHQVLIPIVTDNVIGLRVPVTGSANAVNETIVHHSFSYDGFLRQVIIEPVASATGAGSNMDISLIRYGTRTVGGGTFEVGSQLVIVSNINVGAAGPTIIDLATLGAAAASKSAILGAGHGSALTGFNVTAGNGTTTTGGGFTLLVSAINGGCTMQDIMVSYLLQISTS